MISVRCFVEEASLLSSWQTGCLFCIYTVRVRCVQLSVICMCAIFILRRVLWICSAPCLRIESTIMLQNCQITLLWPPKARPLYFTAVISFFFISSAYMKDQPWDRNQTWSVGRKWCRFTTAPPQKKWAGHPQIWGAKKSNFDHGFATSALNTAYLRNETSYRRTKMLVSSYNVSPKRWPTFRDLWPRNGWDPFAYCVPPFGGHYVATITVVTCLVTYNLGNAFIYLLGLCIVWEER